jgi:hypothetical protein
MSIAVVSGSSRICAMLGVSASAYYQRASGERSVRAVEDERLTGRIREVHEANYECYGYRRVHAQLVREDETAGRDRVARLMGTAGVQGAKRRGKPWRTTTADPEAQRPCDLVRRDFTATAPDRLWVCDFTYLRCWEGRAFFSFVIDVYSRLIADRVWRTRGQLELAVVEWECVVQPRPVALIASEHPPRRARTTTRRARRRPNRCRAPTALTDLNGPVGVRPLRGRLRSCGIRHSHQPDILTYRTHKPCLRGSQGSSRSRAEPVKVGRLRRSLAGDVASHRIRNCRRFSSSLTSVSKNGVGLLRGGQSLGTVR